MSSDQHNLTMANVDFFTVRLFGILQYVQCILHGLTSAFLYGPLIFAYKLSRPQATVHHYKIL